MPKEKGRDFRRKTQMPKTLGELNYLAEKYDWQKGPLTRAKINRMTADESAWHSIVNGEELNRAWNEDKVNAESKRATEAAATEQYWNEGRATEQSIKEVQRFIARFPQFRGDNIGNREALINFLKER